MESGVKISTYLVYHHNDLYLELLTSNLLSTVDTYSLKWKAKHDKS